MSVVCPACLINSLVIMALAWFSSSHELHFIFQAEKKPALSASVPVYLKLMNVLTPNGC